MKAAILAAGRGERLVRAGIPIDKPLISIGGQPLIDRVIHAAASVGATAAVCIVNDLSPILHRHLSSAAWPLSLNVIRKTTDNSLESFGCLAPYLHEEPFLLFTVDAVFRVSALARFLTGARRLGGGVLALTRFIDDEKPLHVDIGPDHEVRGIGEEVAASPYVTAGFYYFQPDVLNLLPDAHGSGLSSLRQFFRFLTTIDYRLSGVRVSKTIDVDQPKDILTAENYVMGRAG
jgi:NDP-sugar pyrophosphorylase family protein